MTTTVGPNGPTQRKQLSHQLDRLDTIIDALADNLNQAVADAAREATQVAVREVMVALLTDPATRALLRDVVGHPGGAATPTIASQPPRPSLGSRLRESLGRTATKAAAAAGKVACAVTRAISAAGGAARAAVTDTARQVAGAAVRATAAVTRAIRAAAANRTLRTAVLVAVGVGTVALVVTARSVALVTLVGGITALAAAGRAEARRLARRLGLQLGVG
jgi:hypothetical protein